MEGRKYETYGGIRKSSGKVYLVEFTNKETGEQFLKFGVTSSYDILDRFKSDEYNKWVVRPLASAYGTKEQVEEAEQKFLNKYPKNFWLEEKIRGVTEVVKMDRQTRNAAIQEVRQLSSDLKMLRENK
jgi:hypothetical protein